MLNFMLQFPAGIVKRSLFEVPHSPTSLLLPGDEESSTWEVLRLAFLACLSCSPPSLSLSLYFHSPQSKAQDHPQCPGKRGQRHRLHLKVSWCIHPVHIPFSGSVVCPLIRSFSIFHLTLHGAWPAGGLVV